MLGPPRITQTRCAPQQRARNHRSNSDAGPNRRVCLRLAYYATPTPEAALIKSASRLATGGSRHAQPLSEYRGPDHAVVHA
jgi:hypothetical protein